MIDGKKLAKDEAFMRTMAEKHSGGTECFLREAEIIRNARRYLALRENEIATFAELAKKGIHVPLTPEEHRAAYDAAADRLLEGGV